MCKRISPKKMARPLTSVFISERSEEHENEMALTMEPDESLNPPNTIKQTKKTNSNANKESKPKTNAIKSIESSFKNEFVRNKKKLKRPNYNLNEENINIMSNILLSQIKNSMLNIIENIDDLQLNKITLQIKRKNTSKNVFKNILKTFCRKRFRTK